MDENLEFTEMFSASEQDAINELVPTIKSNNGSANNGAKQYLPTAYQVIALKRTTRFGNPHIERVIIDTYDVKNGLAEQAKGLAVKKAKMMGHCMVIELCERSVIQIEEPTMQSETILYKHGHKRTRGKNN